MKKKTQNWLEKINIDELLEKFKIELERKESLRKWKEEKIKEIKNQIGEKK